MRRRSQALGIDALQLLGSIQEIVQANEGKQPYPATPLRWIGQAKAEVAQAVTPSNRLPLHRSVVRQGAQHAKHGAAITLTLVERKLPDDIDAALHGRQMQRDRMQQVVVRMAALPSWHITGNDFWVASDKRIEPFCQGFDPCMQETVGNAQLLANKQYVVSCDSQPLEDRERFRVAAKRVGSSRAVCHKDAEDSPARPSLLLDLMEHTKLIVLVRQQKKSKWGAGISTHRSQ